MINLTIKRNVQGIILSNKKICELYNFDRFRDYTNNASHKHLWPCLTPVISWTKLTTEDTFTN